MEQIKDSKLSVGELVNKLSSLEHLKLIDTKTLQRKLTLLNALKDFQYMVNEGPTGTGRARYGMVLSGGSTTPWAKDHPINFFSSPVVLDLKTSTSELVSGLIDGHTRHLLDNIKLLRRGKLEVKDKYDPDYHDALIAGLSWKDLDDEEKALVPPVLLIGTGDSLIKKELADLIDLLNGKWPVKVCVIDDALPSGKEMLIHAGQVDTKLLAIMMSGDVFVLKGTMADKRHLFKGLIDGMRFSQAALFYLYAPGNGKYANSVKEWEGLASLAISTRVFPVFRYDPESGNERSFSKGLSLKNNPSFEDHWSEITLKFAENEEMKEINYSPTYADWLFVHETFQDHFKLVDSPGKDTVPVAEYLTMNDQVTKNLTPVIFRIDEHNKLQCWSVSTEIVGATRSVFRNWRTLSEIAGLYAQFPAQVREEVEKELTAKHQEAIEQLEKEFQEKLKNQEQQHMEVVKKKLKEKLLQLSKIRKGDI
jgi:pyruvate-ferredoxin/flavodoxin oxidoreductase